MAHCEGPWEAINKLPLSTPQSFEDTKEDENHQYLTLLNDHPEGEDVLIIPRSILRIRVKKGELP